VLLNQLQKGDRAKIVNILAGKELRDRFNSFGLMIEETIAVKTYSFAKQTMEIEIGSTSVALRADEAAKIEVKKC
jgi:ferrous iron transport protein A